MSFVFQLDLLLWQETGSKTANIKQIKEERKSERDIEREALCIRLKQWPGSPLIRIMFLKYFLTSSVHAAQTCAVSMWQHWNRSYAFWLKTSSHIVLASQRFVEWCVMKFPIIDMFNWSRCTFLWPFHSCGCDYYFNVMLLSSDLSKKIHFIYAAVININ